MFQKRNYKSNCCLISAPILFCVLLFMIQTVVNRVLLNSDDFKVGAWHRRARWIRRWPAAQAAAPGARLAGAAGRPRARPAVLSTRRLPPPPPSLAQCGCRCTQCCTTTNGVETCRALTQGYCSDTCKARDESACGIQYSTPVQATFCPVPRPSSWPPVVQVRARRSRTQRAPLPPSRPVRHDAPGPHAAP